MKAEKSERDREFDERWERAKRVRVERSQDKRKTSVFSIKMDRELLRALVERARELGIGTSTLARNLIAQGLAGEGHDLTDEMLIELIKQRMMRKMSESGSAKNVRFMVKDYTEWIVGPKSKGIGCSECKETVSGEGSTLYLTLTGS